MSKSILIYQCPLCRSWQSLERDRECDCGLMIDEPGDPHANPQRTALAVMEINLGEAVEALARNVDRIEKFPDEDEPSIESFRGIFKTPPSDSADVR